MNDAKTQAAELKKQTEYLTRLLSCLDGNTDTAKCAATVRQFLMYTLHQYLFVRLSPKVQDDAVLQAYLERSGSTLKGLQQFIEGFVDSTSAIMDSAFVSGEWKILCERRSAIEALRELYQSTPYGEYLPYLETEDLDERMENTGQQEGYLDTDQIPVGMPSSHWWWWYPAPPPDAS